VAVALDLTGLSEVGYLRLQAVTLERGIVVRLVQEGFAVVSVASKPELIVRVVEQPSGFLIQAQGAGGAMQREIAWSGEPTAELHLEIAQKVAELVRACLRAGIVPAPPPPAQLDTGVTPELGAFGEGVWRGQAIDPGFRLGFRLGVGLGIGLHISTGFLPSFATGIRVIEVPVQAGPGLRMRLSARTDVELAVLVGLLIHSYAVTGDAADASGTRLGLVGSAPLAFLVRVTQRLAVDLHVLPGLAQGVVHIQNEQPIWQSDSFRLEAGIGASWRF